MNTISKFRCAVAFAALSLALSACSGGGTTTSGGIEDPSAPVAPPPGPVAAPTSITAPAPSAGASSSPPLQNEALGQRIARFEYKIEPQGEALGAPNREAGLRLLWSAEGLTVTPRKPIDAARAASARFAVTRVSRGASELALLATPFVLGACQHDDALDESGACLHRSERKLADGIVEWWENRPDGIEHGFSLPERPLSAGDGALRIAVQIHASRVTLDRDGKRATILLMADHSLTYDGLVARDASGKQLASRMVPTSDGLALEVDDRGAAYPIEVDPVLGTGPDWQKDTSNQTNSAFGVSFAALDVNADGFGDLVVGAPNFDTSFTDAGRIYLFLGSSTGLATTAVWQQSGSAANAHYGTALAAFDGNADGYMDLAVGGPGSNKVYIYSNGSNPGSFHTNAFSITSPHTSTSTFGAALARVDMNHDGYDDVAVGEPGAVYSTGSGGWVGVYLGSPTAVLGSTSTWTTGSDVNGAQCGTSIASGDTTGDGFDDLLVACKAQPNPIVGEGVAWLYAGQGSGVFGTWWSPTWTFRTVQAYAGVGVVAMADLNADQKAEILISSPGYNGGSHPGEGKTFLFQGPVTSSTPLGETWSTLGGANSAALQGFMVGDVNHDGFGDFALGAPGFNANAGQAWLYLGKPGALTSMSAATWAPTVPSGSQFGFPIGSAGDVNGDGIGDLVVGLKTFTSNFSNEGGVYVYDGSATSPQYTGTPVVSSPTIKATWAALQGSGALTNTSLDGPGSFVVGGTRWLATHVDYVNGGTKQVLMTGGVDGPYGSVLYNWPKWTCDRPSPAFVCVPNPSSSYAFNAFGPDVNDAVELWFVGIYAVPGTPSEMIAFVHEEQVGQSQIADPPWGKTRIGLAWSADGSSWTYLGRIISPDATGGEPTHFNVQGAPYVVKDGYFYVYYLDRTHYPGGGTGDQLNVARAPIGVVISLARQGKVSLDPLSGGGRREIWRKRHAVASDLTGPKNWISNGLGGAAAVIPYVGTIHTQAVHSSYSGKYYLPLTQVSGPAGDAGPGVPTYVQLYESVDAVNWAPSTTIVQEDATTQGPGGGYQYCSAVDPSGAPNGEVGQKFYVYCLKFSDRVAGDNQALYRWTVDLGNPTNFYRQSKDFSSSQGPRWKYQYGPTLLNMTYDSVNHLWHGADPLDKIDAFGLGRGATERPTLTWVAPSNGTVRVSGTVRDAKLTCGAGAQATISKNGALLANVGNWANGDTVGVSYDSNVTVVANDQLQFTIDAYGGGSSCDYAIWDPSIQYQ